MGKRQHESKPSGFYIKKFIDAVVSDPAKEPQDFDRALFEMKHSPDNDSNAYLFWTHGGLSAWAIFYRAKHRANRHRDILPGLKKAMRSFENEKIEVRTLVAKGINGALPLNLRTQYQNHSSNPNKRQRTIDITTDPAEDQHALADDIEAATDTFQDNTYYRLSSPQAFKAQNLFPEVLFNILSQDRPKNDSNVWTAGIEMAFAVGKNFDNKLDSIMSLTIVSNQVAFLAKHLFDVHIMSTEDRRYVHDNGTGMDFHPRPEIALYGCKREVILETFGKTIASAITASPAYIEEKRRCRPRTGCVNMTFTDMVNDVAIINLYMAEKESFWVKQALWGK